MKKNILILSLSLISALLSQAQQVVHDDFNRLEIHFTTPELHLKPTAFGEEKFISLSIDGYTQGGEIGMPALPQWNDYVEVPFCENIEVEVTKARYDTLTGVATLPIWPMQPSRLKSDTTRPQLVKNDDGYAQRGYYSQPLGQVRVAGVARDRRLALLSYSPLQVDPTTGDIIICRSADITLHYRQADVEGTLDHYRRYHTPAFVGTKTVNNLLAKAPTENLPLRMVVVMGKNLAEGNMQQFLDWKRSQGMMVDYWHLSDFTSIQKVTDSLNALFTNASEDSPAPLYVLLVGDYLQLPAFNSRLSSTSQILQECGNHVTDHYFASWTDDMLSDAFVGRFSASNQEMLNNIISKTLLYEQYGFQDDNYLTKGVLIAGVDNSYQNEFYNNALRCADPSMDYIAREYIRAEHGYNTVWYYKNRTDFSPDGVTVTGSSSATGINDSLRALYDQGIGWVNYSAHGLETNWSSPTFTVNNANNMQNNNKPSIMIGNCCLTNAFDGTTCLGEALLRKNNNAGAVVYVGATNSTLWDEDFYWSVGYRSTVSGTMNTPYNEENRGAYDHLFHTHGETLDQHAATIGEMINAGLLAVNSSASSSFDQQEIVDYYWEIYELMGDPSLLPWLGKAQELAIGIEEGENTIKVTSAPGAYTALVLDGQLISTAFADAVGMATLTLPDGEIDSCILSVTAQGYKPYSIKLSQILVGVQQVENPQNDITIHPNPATDMVRVESGERNVESIEVIDLHGRIVMRQQSITPHSSIHINVSTLTPGIYLVRVTSNNSVQTKKLIIK